MIDNFLGRISGFWHAVIGRLFYSSPYDVKIKIRSVRRIYVEVDRATQSFRKKVGLGCPDRCGHCCANSNVETTVLEMLPLAEELLRRGEAEAWWQETENRDFPGQCVFYIPDEGEQNQGRCGVYALRPLICRMFGYTGNKDKYGRIRLVACNVMKKLLPHVLEEALHRVDIGKDQPPVMADVIMRTSMLDPELTKESIAINTAFRKAVERMWLSRRYRE
ncbi:MAG: YkgJ family cysteine cluster protein [Candidatus Omnitrophica bacterium]|nr:YkgJ family cysteine cluster protein [Candidatus Omnitrophota bacterium]